MKLLIFPSLLAAFALSFTSCSDSIAQQNEGNTLEKMEVVETSFTENTPGMATLTDGAPAIEVEVDSYNFGEVKLNEPASHKFVFTNTGTTELVIEKVKPSCSCTTPDWTKTPIQPGETGFVVAEYNSKKVGMFHKTVSILSNAPGAPKVLTISGEVVAAE